MAWAIVIFGAAVRPDGRASAALRRRVALGAAAAGEAPEDQVFCSGGVGRFGASEASVMRELLLARGVDPERIAMDEASRDTLENVVAAASFIRGRDLEGAVVCTDDYHVPRARMLFAALGVASRPGPLGSGRAGAPFWPWLGMQAREFAAYPYDWAVVMRRRQELRRRVEGY